MADEEGNKNYKVTYDSRKNFHDLLKIDLNEYNIAVTSNNLSFAINLAFGITSKLKPYIDNKNFDELRKQLKQAEYANNQNNSKLQMYIMKRLRNVHDNIYFFAKNVIMPTKEEDTDTTIWEDIGNA